MCHLSRLAGSVSAASLRQDAAGLGELGRGDVEEGGARDESQQGQVLLQLVRSGDGDDAVGVEQPVTEQDDQTLLLGDQTLERLNQRKVEVLNLQCRHGPTITQIQKSVCRHLLPLNKPVSYCQL